jgi:hypothetical protein
MKIGLAPSRARPGRQRAAPLEDRRLRTHARPRFACYMPCTVSRWRGEVGPAAVDSGCGLSGRSAQARAGEGDSSESNGWVRPRLSSLNHVVGA